MKGDRRLRPLVTILEEGLAELQGTTIGVPGNQSGASFAFSVNATTVNAGTVTVDTGYKPPANHGAKIDGGFTVIDRANHLIHAFNTNGAVRNFGGLAIAGTPLIGGSTGDDAGVAPHLAASTIVFGVSGGGTLTITFTPPAGYVGTLDWLQSLLLTEN